jgi:hypothetical protein
VASLPENQWPWYFKLSGTGGVKLAARNEKLCYAQLALSATLDLRGDGAGAVQEIGRAAATCGPRLEDVKAVVSWELERVADEVPELAARAAASRRRLLAE